MEPGVEARVREAVAALEAAGATVEEVSLPHTDYGLATYYIVAPAEASANLARYDGIRYGPSPRRDGDFIADYLATRGQGFGAEVKRRIMLGTYALSAGYYDAFYLKAQKVRTLIKRDFDAALGVGLRCARRADVADGRVPVRARGWPTRSSMYLSDACTLPVNMAGLPGVSASRRLVGRACRSASSSSARLVGGVAVRPGPRLRGDHRRCRVAGARARRPRRRRRPGDADACRAAARRSPASSVA